MTISQISLSVVAGVVVIAGLMWGLPAYNRYQRLADERNGIQVNEIQIQQTKQLVQVQQQKAQIKIAEALRKLIDLGLIAQRGSGSNTYYEARY